MIKKYALCLAVLLSSTAIYAQQQSFNEPCMAEYMFNEYAKKDPSLYQKRADMEQQTSALIKDRQSKKQSAETRIIPVVFHVIYDDPCGAENISKEQILDQIRILNEDFRRRNVDTVRTPIPFQKLAADVNVEFRLAQKDTNGFCTDGIVRRQSSLTNDARDNVKAISYWDSKRYLNIWSVKTISGATPPRYVLGYAQFPNTGSATTDGVVLRSDVIGSIGTGASSFNSRGRTACHEVGHWLNLRHIWGDADCGNDMVDDTPTHKEANERCPTFPKLNSCATGDKENGEMFTDYMDYTDGSCQNMFSKGQSARMNATLDGFRSKLCSIDNLIETGVLDSVSGDCYPVAEFCYSGKAVCAGTAVTFTDKTWNAAPTSWKWYLPGSDQPIATGPNPTVIYANAGTYDVTLVVKAGFLQDSLVRKQSLKVLPTQSVNVAPFTEDFEASQLNALGWLVENKDSNVSVWQSIQGVSALSGNRAVMLNNKENTKSQSIDNLYAPTVSYLNTNSPGLSFYYAYSYKATTASDVLKIYSSENCGKTWVLRRTLTSAQLKTGANTAQTYIPHPGEWKQNSISMPTLAGSKNVGFKFEFTSGTGGNNLYLDKINMGEYAAANGIKEEEIASNLNLSVIPNPNNGNAMLTFNLVSGERVQAEVLDMLGRSVSTLLKAQTYSEGSHSINIEGIASGIYIVKLTVGSQLFMQKMVVN